MRTIQLSQPVSVVMPICNEADVIQAVLDEWHRDVFAHLPQGSELLFDDCSTDGTTELLFENAKQRKYIRVISSSRDGFFESAKRLYLQAKCPLIFFTDSDGQYVATEFWRVAECISRCDLAHGAKLGRQDPLYRLVASHAFNLLVMLLFFTRGRDVNSAFRLVRKSVVEQVLPQVHCVPVLLNSEFYLRAERQGFKIEVIDVEHRPRQFGKSRGVAPGAFLRICFDVFKGVIRLRRDL